jgi:glycosyltransferase involved in cell wall biosynthesis
VNVLFLSELFYPHGGGAELATYLYAKLLGERGFNVIVITNKFEGEPTATKNYNFTIIRLPLFKLKESIKYSVLQKTNILLSSFFRKMIRWTDVVYIPRFWYSAILLAKNHKKPVVVHLHDYIPICPLANFFNVTRGAICDKRGLMCSQRCIYAYERMNSRRLVGVVGSTLINSTFGCLYGRIVTLSDVVICVSNFQKNLLLRNGAFSPSKVRVIYNPLPETKENSLEVRGDDFGYFGGPSYLKGFHILHQAVKSINVERGKKINVHITNFSNFPMRFLNKLRQIGFIPYGRLEGKLLEKTYKKLKCIVVPSVCPETFSYVTVEALIRGKLVIASDVGAIREITDGCENVFLFEPGNYNALAESILHVKGLNKEKAVELGLRNRELMLKKFNNEKIARSFISLLEKVVD